jgi:DNA-binding NarL/FixJ family response regulator
MNAEMKSCPILIVDDHPVVRRGVSSLLSDEPDLTICGEAASGKEALSAIKKCKPGLVILDITFPDCDGIEICREIRVRHPDLPILMMSIHSESLYADRALRAGANGYIMKHEAPETIVKAIRQILSGKVHVSNETLQEMLLQPAKRGRTASPIDSLSARELEVFSLIGQGQGTREMARRLDLGLKTVETHRLNIKRKLKVRHTTELIKRAVEWFNASRRQPDPEA